METKLATVPGLFKEWRQSPQRREYDALQAELDADKVDPRKYNLFSTAELHPEVPRPIQPLSPERLERLKVCSCNLGVCHVALPCRVLLWWLPLHGTSHL